MGGITGAIWSAGKSRLTGLNQAIDTGLFNVGIGMSALNNRVKSCDAYNKVVDVYGEIKGSAYAKQAVSDIHAVGHAISNNDVAIAINNAVGHASSGAHNIAQGIVANEHVQKGMAIAAESKDLAAGVMADAKATAKNGLGVAMAKMDNLPGMVMGVRLGTQERRDRMFHLLKQEYGLSSRAAEASLANFDKSGSSLYGVTPMGRINYHYMKADGNYDLGKFGRDAGIAAGAAVGLGAAGYGAAHFFGDD